MTARSIAICGPRRAGGLARARGAAHRLRCACAASRAAAAGARAAAAATARAVARAMARARHRRRTAAGLRRDLGTVRRADAQPRLHRCDLVHQGLLYRAGSDRARALPRPHQAPHAALCERRRRCDWPRAMPAGSRMDAAFAWSRRCSTRTGAASSWRWRRCPARRSRQRRGRAGGGGRRRRVGGAFSALPLPYRAAGIARSCCRDGLEHALRLRDAVALRVVHADVPAASG